MKISETKEMYLETILILQKEDLLVHSIRISEKLNVSRSTVSRMLKNLEEDGCLKIDEFKHVKLTSEGEKIAKRIYDRHVTLQNLLLKLGIDKKTAEEDACRIEHVISEKTYKAIKKIFN